VFGGLSPNLDAAIIRAGEEKEVWKLAGAKNLALLMAPIPGIYFLVVGWSLFRHPFSCFVVMLVSLGCLGPY
jgi:hypothetical protein